jgi:acyl carrier protein
MESGETTAELRRKIKELLVSKLRLRMAPNEIADDQPLFGGGLGLDSIDVLEVVAAIEKEFGVAIQSQEEGERVLKSVNAIAAFLVERGYRPGS